MVKKRWGTLEVLRRRKHAQTTSDNSWHDWTTLGPRLTSITPNGRINSISCTPRSTQSSRSCCSLIPPHPQKKYLLSTLGSDFFHSNPPFLGSLPGLNRWCLLSITPPGPPSTRYRNTGSTGSTGTLDTEHRWVPFGRKPTGRSYRGAGTRPGIHKDLPGSRPGEEKITPAPAPRRTPRRGPHRWSPHPRTR